MLGLLVIGLFVLYLAIFVVVVRWAVRAAKRRGIAGWKWGFPAALMMYLIVFWDHIPTILLYEHYCQSQAGFWLYKTPEQWMAENPSEAKKIEDAPIPNEELDANGRWVRRYLNSRFALTRREWRSPILPVGIAELVIVDTETGKAMAKESRVDSGVGSLGQGGKDWRVVKFWLRPTRSCLGPTNFFNVLDGFRKLREENK
jgi:hypothetical protein